ncbi:CDP-diacylglycerol--glycerol-3-phosphate 3-phosphatidyltransferase, partial [Ascosphaera atra]
NKILSAKRRIYLSTLYIGNAEYDLILAISTALKNNPDLKVSILTDALRGTRESPKSSCASLLAGLVKEHGSERVEIRMFHTPKFRGLKKKIVPKRINEGWGLQHMKLYGIDDEIILSGCETAIQVLRRGHRQLMISPAERTCRTTISRTESTDITSSARNRLQTTMQESTTRFAV